MNELTSDEIKSIAFNVLKSVRDVCDELEIRYMLTGGTLLGSVRHGGFIPWDDDIDIAMPRPDYDRFVMYCKNNDVPFGLLCHETDERFADLAAKAYDKETVCVEQFANRYETEYGVFVDIFPIDGLGDTYKSALKNYRKTRYKRSVLVASNWKKFEKSKTRKWYYEPFRYYFYVFSRKANTQKLIEKIERNYVTHNFDDSDFVGIVSGSYGDKEVMPREYFDKYIDICFEGEQFKTIEQYDVFLKHVYGDYMELPPESERVSRHSFIAYKK